MCTRRTTPEAAMAKIWRYLKYWLGRWAEWFALIPLTGAMVYDGILGFGFDELVWIGTMIWVTRLYGFARWTRERSAHDTFWGRLCIKVGDYAEWAAVLPFGFALLFDASSGVGLDELFWAIAIAISVRLIKFACWARECDLEQVNTKALASA